jgi:hypothetical protein
MKDDVYVKLREYLNRLPLGFPATPSGVELEILKKLFSEEEAETALLLSPLPEEVDRIAARCGVDSGELDEKLENMSRKGLAHRIRRQGKTYYNSVPFMIGLYEYSVKKIDKELAAL